MIDNFGVKVNEKIINRVLHAHDIERTKPILRPKFDERIKKSRTELCKYYLYTVDNAKYVYTDKSHFYTKNPYSERWVFPSEEFHEKQRKSGNQRISVYDAISRKAKFPLIFFTGNMDLKIYWMSFRDPTKFSRYFWKQVYPIYGQRCQACISWDFKVRQWLWNWNRSTSFSWY